ncbi:MAG: hypothetical protein H6559_20075 [Lewinellaceae bacterium]|nr:hypothetical protein [Lewinellaceae bacterium]
MKTQLTILFALIWVLAFGQTSIRPSGLVQSAQETGAAFTPVQLFRTVPGAALEGEKAPQSP